MTFDPTGPGTPAWNEADHAIELWPIHRRKAGMAMARMIGHLKAHGKSHEEIEQWRTFVRKEQGRETYITTVERPVE